MHDSELDAMGIHVLPFPSDIFCGKESCNAVAGLTVSSIPHRTVFAGKGVGLNSAPISKVRAVSSALKSLSNGASLLAELGTVQDVWTTYTEFQSAPKRRVRLQCNL